MPENVTCIICHQPTNLIEEKTYQSKQYEICHCRQCDLKFYRHIEKTPTEYYRCLYGNWNVEGISLRGLAWGHHQALRLAKKHGKTSLLDIGCAEGLFIKEAARKGLRASGIDINPELIKIARQTYGLETASCLNLEDLEGKFDMITMIDVLEHLHNPGEYINQMKKNLNKNGFVFVGLPNPGCHPQFLPIDGDLPPHHLTWWSKKSLFYLFQSNDYEVLEYQTQKVDPKDMAVWFDHLLGSRFKGFKNNKQLIQKIALESENKRLKKSLYWLKKCELELLAAAFCLPAAILTFSGSIGNAHYILAQKKN
ncbi:MAG: class I SAM-dependent methyltransferase [Patescibacteria group bacterium]